MSYLNDKLSLLPLGGGDAGADTQFERGPRLAATCDERATARLRLRHAPASRATSQTPARHLVAPPRNSLHRCRRRGAALALRMSATTKITYLYFYYVCRNSLHRCSTRRGADLALLTDGARVPPEYALTLLTFTRLCSQAWGGRSRFTYRWSARAAY
jgi:hypothetical protein